MSFAGADPGSYEGGEGVPIFTSPYVGQEACYTRNFQEFGL